jgi:hypothetical protein
MRKVARSLTPDVIPRDLTLVERMSALASVA